MGWHFIRKRLVGTQAGCSPAGSSWMLDVSIAPRSGEEKGACRAARHETEPKKMRNIFGTLRKSVTYQLVRMPLRAVTQPKKRERNPVETREKLVRATVQLILKQGFAATTVDQICAEAELTKGSFFHHFDSKEAIGKAAVEWWGAFGTALYAEAWKDEGLDPLEQASSHAGHHERVHGAAG